MRFADLDGADARRLPGAHAHDATSAGADVPGARSTRSSTGRVGPEGYYGVFTANMHTDEPGSHGSDAIVASALARGVPVITARQVLTGSTAATARRSARSPGAATRSASRSPSAPAATGCRAMLPMRAGGEDAQRVTRGGNAVAVHDPDDQGDRVRGLHRGGRLVRGDLRALSLAGGQPKASTPTARMVFGSG